MRFNHLAQISQHTFFDLEVSFKTIDCLQCVFNFKSFIIKALRKLHLDDNKIEKIERRAFMNLDELEHLSLRGNKLNNLAEESFQVSNGN